MIEHTSSLHRRFSVVAGSALLMVGATFACAHRGFAGASLAQDQTPAPSVATNNAQASSPFLIAPYLYSVGSGQIHLAWQYQAQASVNHPEEVQVFLPTGTVTVTAKIEEQLWTADLPISQCGFKDVSYQVNGMAHAQKIVPIPCAGDSSPAKFAFISDAQEHPEFLREVVAKIEQQPTSALLSAGDFVQNGNQNQEWVDSFNATAALNAERVLFPAVGNHEYRNQPDARLWSHYFHLADVDAHYSFQIGDAHIIVLNSCFYDQPSLIDSQLPWLTKELAVPARWKIVMFHHPPYSRGIANNSLAPKKEFRDLQKKYVPLFETYKVDMVLLGHTHLFERSLKDGVQYLIAGPAGGKMGQYGATNIYSVKSAQVRTATFFTVTSDALEALTMDPLGNEVDSLKLTKAL
jgi:predicted phosphodiesterase